MSCQAPSDSTLCQREDIEEVEAAVVSGPTSEIVTATKCASSIQLKTPCLDAQEQGTFRNRASSATHDV